MKVLVTGSSGFIGTNLTRALNDVSHDVAGVDIVPPAAPTYATHHQADVKNCEAIVSVLRHEQPDAVVHLAARTDFVTSPDLAEYSTNIDGVAELLRALRVSPVKRALFASSRLVFDPGARPAHRFDYSANNDYGRSKVAGERLVLDEANRSSTTEYVLMRPTSIWGPHFSLPYAQFFGTVLAGTYRHPGGYDVWKSFGYVENVCQQIVALLEAETIPDEPVWLTDLQPIEIREFANRIRAAVGSAPVREIPIGVLRLGAIIGDQLERIGLEGKFPLTTSRLRNMTIDTVYDTALENDLYQNVKVVGIEEGIERTLTHLGKI